MSNRFKLNGIIYQEVIKYPEEGDLIVLNDNHTEIVGFTASFNDIEIATVVIAVDEEDDS